MGDEMKSGLDLGRQTCGIVVAIYLGPGQTFDRCPHSKPLWIVEGAADQVRNGLHSLLSTRPRDAFLLPDGNHSLLGTRPPDAFLLPDQNRHFAPAVATRVVW